MKRFGKHLKLFFSDNATYIIMFLMAPAGLVFASLRLSDAMPCSGGYYLALCAALLAVFLAVRLYTTWNYYALLCSRPTSFDELRLKKGRCAFERHFDELCERTHSLYSRDMADAEEKRRLGEQILFQWVHQQKTPLSVISLMAQKHPTSSEWSRVSAEAGVMDYGLRQILDFYRIQAMEHDMHAQRVNLRDAAGAAINDLKGAFIENSVFPRNAVDAGFEVHSDLKWLRSILYQLLSNAIKYSDANGAVTVGARREGHNVLLFVKDDGCGIERSDIGRIFELFFTGQNGRKNSESSGLGLYMVKTACDYLGHEIRVESQPGKGSAFTVVFHERGEE